MKTWRLEKKKNRKAAFAGKFYSLSKQDLNSELDKLFKNSKQIISSKNQTQAIISPHAGYVFSGQVAASAFNQINTEAKYKRVFVVASSHQYFFNGAAVYSEGNYETPLGEIEVDLKLAKKLQKKTGIFHLHNEAHFFEHSLEVQLPFLQKKLKNEFLLVPVILGTNSKEDCMEIAKALQPWFTPENLFVISTDFSHYPEYYEANEVDLITAEAICENNPGKLLKVLKNNKKRKVENLATSLCGWTSVLTLLYLTEKRNVSYVKIEYKNSGDAELYGDKNRVVGYWALAVFNNNEQLIISDEEKDKILEKARVSIQQFLKTGKQNIISDIEDSGILKAKAGVFVSVYVKNELRGCIGCFPQEKTLNELVQEMAVSSVCDKRFEHLKPEELNDLELEISVLSPLKKIKSANEIELGKHGIYIRKGMNSGTFLPQVAIKTGWSVEEFLGKCSRDKAGIGWDGWKTAELFTYEAVIFKGK